MEPSARSDWGQNRVKAARRPHHYVSRVSNVLNSGWRHNSRYVAAGASAASTLHTAESLLAGPCPLYLSSSRHQRAFAFHQVSVSRCSWLPLLNVCSLVQLSTAVARRSARAFSFHRTALAIRASGCIGVLLRWVLKVALARQRASKTPRRNVESQGEISQAQ